jgi:hypothetical protein
MSLETDSITGSFEEAGTGTGNGEGSGSFSGSYQVPDDTVQVGVLEPQPLGSGSDVIGMAKAELKAERLLVRLAIVQRVLNVAEDQLPEPILDDWERQGHLKLRRIVAIMVLKRQELRPLVDALATDIHYGRKFAAAIKSGEYREVNAQVSEMVDVLQHIPELDRALNEMEMQFGPGFDMGTEYAALVAA